MDPRVRHIFSRRFGHEIIPAAILPLPLIQEEQLSVNGEMMCAYTGYLPRGGLPRNSVYTITDRPDMTSAVDRGCKASTQTNKQISNLYTLKIYIRAESLTFSHFMTEKWPCLNYLFNHDM